MSDPQVLYRAYDADDVLLYVGITLNVSQRFSSHRQEREWWSRVATIRLQHFATRAEVEEAEREAIHRERPLGNRLRYTSARSPSITPERRESNRRRARMTRDQQHWFKAVRKIAHDEPRARHEAAQAREHGVSEDDIAWALAHPIRYWGPATNHPKSRHGRTSGA